MSVSIANNNQYTVKGRFRHLNLSHLCEIVFSARKEVKPRRCYDLAKVIKMPEKTLAGIINLSARTISNYKEQQKVNYSR